MEERIKERLEEFKKELEPYKNTLVLDNFEVVKVIDIVFDEEDYEYYWVYESLNSKKKTYWSSCVGRWYPLKGKIAVEEYNNLERIWKLNENR